MENLLPPLAILLVVAAAVVLAIRAGVRRSRASLGDALSGGPEAAAAAAARLTEAQHRSIYSLIARGQTVEAIAAYREATRARLVEARNAVLLMDRYPQPYRGGQTPAARDGAPPAPAPAAPAAPSGPEPSGPEPSRTEHSRTEPARAESAGAAPAQPGAAGPEARAHRDAAEAPKAPGPSTRAESADAARAGDTPPATGTPKPPPAVVRPTGQQPQQPQPTGEAPAGEGRPQRFPYRYRAIVSNGRQTLEVASNMLNDQIYAEIKELAHIGDTEDAAQMLCRHSDISIEDARAFVALL